MTYKLPDKVIREINVNLLPATILVLIFLKNAESIRNSYDYNITSYTRMLPEEIRPIVRRAFNFEQKTSQTNKRGEPCTPDDQIPCPPMKYRKPSGECNNVRHSKWGTRGSALPQDFAAQL
ncbi:hypothetical protein NQ317_008532 [Molorchus minor]|uniref:Uncharacterized protein n=1 Tax=Molorchus minor TaxID=1323400 RepID=A0ABQ9IZM8_9CUCU|nr:hypothetical protein NQ317_008532 [Molorchus minor]